MKKFYRPPAVLDQLFFPDNFKTRVYVSIVQKDKTGNFSLRSYQAPFSEMAALEAALQSRSFVQTACPGQLSRYP